MEEHAAGFRYENSGWRATTFKADDKFVIKQPDPTGKNKKMAYIVIEYGRNYPFGWCAEGVNREGILSCYLLGGSFTLNKKTGRYLSTYLAGYIDGVDDNENNPSMQIGKCSPLQ